MSERFIKIFRSIGERLSAIALLKAAEKNDVFLRRIPGGKLKINTQAIKTKGK